MNKMNKEPLNYKFYTALNSIEGRDILDAVEDKYAFKKIIISYRITLQLTKVSLKK